MAMDNNGLTKLTEECGELIQVAAKLQTYSELQFARNKTHPDGTILLDRLELEIGDVIAAILFIKEKLQLDNDAIKNQSKRKLKLFKQWDSEQ